MASSASTRFSHATDDEIEAQLENRHSKKTKDVILSAVRIFKAYLNHIGMHTLDELNVVPVSELQTLARNEFAKWRRRTYRLIESKRNEFFLSVIVFELKYPRRRSFHQIYFPLVNKNRLLKRWLDTIRNWQPSRKKCFYRYHTKGFRATKFRNLLELTVELFRIF